MAEDQYTQRDPRYQHPRPDRQEGREQEHPGTGAEMGPRPDHGESSYRGSNRLVGRKTVITGGDSGIGRAVAVAFAREGADVLLSYLDEEQADAEETAEQVRRAGRQAVLAPGDLRGEEHCQRVVEQAEREFGRVDVLVNNAAYQMSHDDGILGISTEQFDHVMKTNLYAMFWLCKAAVPHMPPGASIINTSSIQAFQPSFHLIDYAMTKAAIVNFTKALSADLVRKGIRVNSVAPGPVWTPLIPATMPADKIDSFGAQTPLGRAAQPAELAPPYVFFASQESSYVTGEVLGVTGGQPLT
ncbi:MAG TPA: SDR family oxidoreductase [Actinophytocola sp.]|uniref:SDR family oxidoreductase n=1 Tax=Actinophytocola sp. TaxID=1872138 RepID=UPI002DDCEF8D|nr:SDR family oxidoreductase [Actinophytocola sp.]HEV2782739.1 SDR family oxidoreductase [Actinophytocola sp.]